MNRALQQKLDIAKLKVNQYQTKLQYVSPESRLHEHRRYAVDLEEKLYRQMEHVLLNCRLVREIHRHGVVHAVQRLLSHVYHREFVP